jgi:FtsH-binding integral membrane protein
MTTYPTAQSTPITLNSSVEGQTYVLLALALGLTLVGGYIGALFAPIFFATGAQLILLFAELGLIIAAPWWSRTAPLNYLMFALFPLFSGITVTPYILSVLVTYTNGESILFNAIASTVFMALGTAVFARSTSFRFSIISRGLMFAVFGLIGLGILQIFFAGLRTGPMELLISGLGMAVFAGFFAYDMQRLQEQGRAGANPFMLALSLYLDLFNLFLYVLRFMTALSGRRD